MKRQLNPIVLSETRYGHQARAFCVSVLIGYFTLPKVETDRWSSPLYWIVVTLALASLAGIIGYPLFWVITLFSQHPVVMSTFFLASGFAVLAEAPDPAYTAAFAPFLVLALVLFAAPVLRFIFWAMAPERNTALETISANS